MSMRTQWCCTMPSLLMKRRCLSLMKATLCGAALSWPTCLLCLLSATLWMTEVTSTRSSCWTNASWASESIKVLCCRSLFIGTYSVSYRGIAINNLSVASFRWTESVCAGCGPDSSRSWSSCGTGTLNAAASRMPNKPWGTWLTRPVTSPSDTLSMSPHSPPPTPGHMFSCVLSGEAPSALTTFTPGSSAAGQVGWQMSAFCHVTAHFRHSEFFI